jgi:shikimate kinase
LKGRAEVMGAITVVNAIACGKGATVAVRLPTHARVEVESRPGRWTAAVNGKKVKPTLASESARGAIRMLKKDPSSYSGHVETITSVPAGVGLKTSSSSSVAIILATISAFGNDSYEPLDVLRSSASSSLEAGVSVTGAMDDAASCLLGGTNLADNLEMDLLRRSPLGRSLSVVIRVPTMESRRSSVGVRQVRRFSDIAQRIFSLAERGSFWKAMTLNGFLYSSIYGYGPGAAVEALEAGASGAGLSGTGPAVAAVFEDRMESQTLAKAWEHEGARVIRTETSDGGATVGV